MTIVKINYVDLINIPMLSERYMRYDHLNLVRDVCEIFYPTVAISALVHAISTVRVPRSLTLNSPAADWLVRVLPLVPSGHQPDHQ